MHLFLTTTARFDDDNERQRGNEKDGEEIPRDVVQRLLGMWYIFLFFLIFLLL